MEAPRTAGDRSGALPARTTPTRRRVQAHATRRRPRHAVTRAVLDAIASPGVDQPSPVRPRPQGHTTAQPGREAVTELAVCAAVYLTLLGLLALVSDRPEDGQ